MAKERDAEELLCSFTNGQKSLCVSPASFLKLPPLQYVRGQEAEVHLFFLKVLLQQNADPSIFQTKILCKETMHSLSHS